MEYISNEKKWYEYSLDNKGNSIIFCINDWNICEDCYEVFVYHSVCDYDVLRRIDIFCFKRKENYKEKDMPVCFEVIGVKGGLKFYNISDLFESLLRTEYNRFYDNSEKYRLED